MNALLKWIGTVSVAIALTLAAGAVAAQIWLADDGADAVLVETSLEEAIPVDPTLFAQGSVDPATLPAIEPAVATAADRAMRPAPAANEAFTVKRILPIDGPIRYGEWHWDEEGLPADALAGPLVVTVDLEARTVSVFRDGYEIGATAAMLGTEAHPTPLGTFPILTKERHNVSEKYGNAPMPWTLRLTWSGIAIHGGSEVENGYASHGCIAVPDPFAARLFDAARKGDKVIITRGKRIGMGDAIL